MKIALKSLVFALIISAGLQAENKKDNNYNDLFQTTTNLLSKKENSMLAFLAGLSIFGTGFFSFATLNDINTQQIKASSALKLSRTVVGIGFFAACFVTSIVCFGNSAKNTIFNNIEQSKQINDNKPD